MDVINILTIIDLLYTYFYFILRLYCDKKKSPPNSKIQNVNLHIFFLQFNALKGYRSPLDAYYNIRTIFHDFNNSKSTVAPAFTQKTNENASYFVYNTTSSYCMLIQHYRYSSTILLWCWFKITSFYV